MRISLGENPSPVLWWGDDGICGCHFSSWRHRSWRIPWVVSFGVGNEMVSLLHTHQVLRVVARIQHPMSSMVIDVQQSISTLARSDRRVLAALSRHWWSYSCATSRSKLVVT
ncbi:hypothetical protein BDA96_10G270000 [Sorghum bicolor]|uniref:Uncharacterized protein n=2 Tax=Sorghum bicolor TaxID=4558 RepID=A0A921Q4R4_SORBI|nr:hypothetical protein BDA96_10G270000 [Sorghum bicolor]OQU76782.1 hypothetical protein SORBI_3010G207450 [Sorghum bicolor]